MITILATLALEHVNEPQVNGRNHGGGCVDGADGVAEDSPPDAS